MKTHPTKSFEKKMDEKRQMIRDAEKLRKRLLAVRDAVAKGKARKDTILLALNDAASALLVHRNMLEAVCKILEKLFQREAQEKALRLSATGVNKI